MFFPQQLMDSITCLAIVSNQLEKSINNTVSEGGTVKLLS